MTQAQFNEIVTKQLAKTTETLTKKAGEYAISEDRLISFKQAASLQKCSTPVALGGMLAKHITSIYQMLPDADYYSSEKWDEKIDDTINYLLLLKACIADMEGDE